MSSTVSGQQQPQHYQPFPQLCHLLLWPELSGLRLERQPILEALPRMGKRARGSWSTTHPYMAALRHDCCAFCGSTHKPTIDHITPLADGGRNNWSNAIGCCHNCNRGKGQDHLLLWMLEDKRLAERRAQNLRQEAKKQKAAKPN